jgi:hypothetical protein
MDGTPYRFEPVSPQRAGDLERFSRRYGKFRHCSCQRWRLTSARYREAGPDGRAAVLAGDPGHRRRRRLVGRLLLPGPAGPPPRLAAAPAGSRVRVRGTVGRRRCRADQELPRSPRAYCATLVITAKGAPAGSASQAIRPTSGTSWAGMTTAPPCSAAMAVTASHSATSK